VKDILERASNRPVSRETFGAVFAFVARLKEENLRQNLVARSTLEELWERHILDSAQLLSFIPDQKACWVDVGSGAGLPGMIIGILNAGEVTLVEPRRLRADFLSRVADDLHLRNVQVNMAKAENVEGRFDVVTARAVAPLTKLLGITAHLAHQETIWVLPKGRSADSELAEARLSWHYDVRAEPSCTDANASILLLTNVRAKSKR
jgi:16S rRNA (guanine527-N7)-methyltransferase